MGQYYVPTIINKNGVETFNAHHYNNGYKLMEHSWVGNYLVQAVITRLYNNPSILFWMGDYAELDDITKKAAEAALFDYNISIGKQFILDVHSDKYDKPAIPEKDFIYPKYFINHTAKVYFDIDKCVSKLAEIAPEDDGWVVHPLPLLTAVGNGRGGGDYYSELDKQFVGNWAGDVIETAYEVPDGYCENIYYFRED